MRYMAASILVVRHGWHPKSIGTAAISACGLLPNGCTKFRHQPELFEHRLERKFDSAFDPKVTLLGVWCILRGSDIGENI